MDFELHPDLHNFLDTINQVCEPFSDLSEIKQIQRLAHTICYNEEFTSAFVLGRIDVVDRLLRGAHVDPSANDNRAIRMASSGGHLAIVDRLLQDPRVDPSVHKNRAVRHASECGHLDVVDRLLQDPRVNPMETDDDDTDAFLLACEAGHLAVVDRLLQDPRVDPSARENSAVHRAFRKRHFQVVERLLQDPRVKVGDLSCTVTVRDNKLAFKSGVKTSVKPKDPVGKLRHAVKQGKLQYSDGAPYWVLENGNAYEYDTDTNTMGMFVGVFDFETAEIV